MSTTVSTVKMSSTRRAHPRAKPSAPAHIAIQGYIKLAAEGRYTEALELIKKENPLPAVCGRICPRKCESACTRAEIDGPIAIDEIKKFIADQDMNEKQRYIQKRGTTTATKKLPSSVRARQVSPARITWPWMGYTVTIFEKEEKPGGMLALGIPAFRLQKDVVDAEIDILKALGIEIKTRRGWPGYHAGCASPSGVYGFLHCYRSTGGKKARY